MFLQHRNPAATKHSMLHLYGEIAKRAIAAGSSRIHLRAQPSLLTLHALFHCFHRFFHSVFITSMPLFFKLLIIRQAPERKEQQMNRVAKVTLFASGGRSSS
jgi:hypothetical protein